VPIASMSNICQDFIDEQDSFLVGNGDNFLSEILEVISSFDT
jgi:hypothetical protein